MRERDIKHENGFYWVGDTRDSYTVYTIGSVCSTPDSSYAHDADGLSVAICRCDYLAKRADERAALARQQADFNEYKDRINRGDQSA